jgi:hypothetical protein
VTELHLGPQVEPGLELGSRVGVELVLAFE